MPLLFVVRSADGIWKSVVEPMLLMEKSVDVAPLLVVEEIVKSVVLTDVDAAWSDSVA